MAYLNASCFSSLSVVQILCSVERSSRMQHTYLIMALLYKSCNQSCHHLYLYGAHDS